MKRLAWAALAVLVGAMLATSVYFAVHWEPDRSVESLKERWARAPSQFVPVLGAQVHLRDEGPREDPLPVVLLHGTSASLHTWDGWSEALREERRVIRFDLPGFGLTGPHPEGRYDMDAFVQSVMAVLDALEVPRCVLGGNSLGARISWNLARAHPERVAGLILVDSGGYPENEVPIALRLSKISFLAPVLDRMLPRSMVASSVRNVYADPSRVTDELVDRYFELALRQGNRGALRERFRQLPYVDPTSKLHEIEQPALLLWGAEDHLYPPEQAHLFDEALPHAELHVLEGLGHVPHEEDPGRTVRFVQNFLAELASSGGPN